MKSYSLLHLDDHVLLRDLATLVSQDRATTAALLAHIAEVDERKLYRSAAYPSMYLYCVRELRMSEETAFRRIRVARTARRFPFIFSALADGRLNLTAVLLVTPYLTQGNCERSAGGGRQQEQERDRVALGAALPAAGPADADPGHRSAECLGRVGPGASRAARHATGSRASWGPCLATGC